MAKYIKKLRHSCKPLYPANKEETQIEIVPFRDGDITRSRVKNHFILQNKDGLKGIKSLIEQFRKDDIKYSLQVCKCNPALIKLNVDESHIDLESNPPQVKTSSGSPESLHFNEVITNHINDQNVNLNSKSDFKKFLNRSRTGKRVAILDTGVSTSLLIDDMKQIFIPAGKGPKGCGDVDQTIVGSDITKSGEGLRDISGHGSFVINSLLFSLLQEQNKSVKIIPVKVFKRVNGIVTAELFDILCGLYYAQKQKADFINLSFGIQTSAHGISLLQNAIQTITKECNHIVCSGGNSGENLNQSTHIPSSFSRSNPFVFEALARRDKHTLLQFSNYYKNVPVNGQSGIAVCGNFSFFIKKLKKSIQVEGTSFASPYLLGKLMNKKVFDDVEKLNRQLTNEIVQVQT